MSRLLDFQSKKVIHEDDPTKSEELINSGKAVELQLPELDRFEQAADEIHETFRKQSESIKTNPNPLYTPEVKAFELEKLEAEYREKSAQIEEEYSAYRKEQQEKTRTQAAQAVVNVTEKDRLTSEQFATRASLELASSSDKGAALKRIVDDMALLTDGQRTALQSEILPVLANVDDDKYGIDKQSVIAAVQSVRNPDLMAHEVAKQLPASVLTKQRIYDMAKQVVSESSALGGGGIDEEFYAKYLKR